MDLSITELMRKGLLREVAQDGNNRLFHFLARGIRISQSDLLHLSQLGHTVTVAVLVDAGIVDEDLEFLVPLSSLEILELSGNAITDVGGKMLSQLKGLECLYVDRTQITTNGVEYLGTSLPSCEILWK